MDAASARAEYLVALVGNYAGKDSRILEVGCREGDNLVTLWQAGFTELRGLESNAAKVSAFKRSHPDIAGRVSVTEGTMEELVRGIEDAAFDLVFTVGFLFDKTGDFTWLFPELSRLTRRHLISIEDEGSGSLRDVYEQLGMKEVDAADLSAKVELDSVFFMRVFEKTP
ncbi:MAG TPA: class I SAM-dependent methyltransferase [Candidatus Anoxymicrobiaceae bacterium]|jgi:Methionine biosynthesis protein MetW